MLTRKYDAHLKPSGLKVTQFSMMVNITRNPGMAVSSLAKLMAMDQTTVTRNLGVLERSGYIQAEQSSDDQRVKRVRISELGKAKLEQARPLWELAQNEMEETLGREGIASLLETFRLLG